VLLLLYLDKSNYCFEQSEKNSPWASHVSAHLANEGLTTLHSKLPFQRACVVDSLGRKRRYFLLRDKADMLPPQHNKDHVSLQSTGQAYLLLITKDSGF
jgi:hypothetical protein